MTIDEQRTYQREHMRRWRAAHPKTPDQLAAEAATRRERRAAKPGHESALARDRRAADPERFREAERRRATLPARRASKRAWGEEHPQAWRVTKMWRLYGLTIEQYEAMGEAQDWLCAICRNPEFATDVRGRVKRLAVDHDHATGAVRSLLCQRCNWLLGIARDDRALLGALADYLAVDR